MSLVKTVDALNEVRTMTHDLLSPCGLPCNCTRIDHVGKLFDGPALAALPAPPNEMARQFMAVANHAHAYVEDLASIPGFAEEVEILWRSARHLGLYVDYVLVQQRVLGDIPAFLSTQGSPRTTGEFSANAGTFVYVARDATEAVIYVGVTDDLFQRMTAHRNSNRWWPYMEKLTWEEWPNRQAALHKESTLIRRYRPRFNVVGNPDAKGKRSWA